jgi:hypothetical protein
LNRNSERIPRSLLRGSSIIDRQGFLDYNAAVIAELSLSVSFALHRLK